LVAGSGEGKTALNAFDAALLASGLGNLNLLKVSSILPPGAKYHQKLEIPFGSLVPTAYGSICSNKPGAIISAAVAVGIPIADTFGVIMETSDYCSKAEIEERISAMVMEAFTIRELEYQEIKVYAVEHQVINCGSAFAGLALWY
jgi:arginine decarboxylase, pyruvoyl-dependent